MSSFESMEDFEFLGCYRRVVTEELSRNDILLEMIRRFEAQIIKPKTNLRVTVESLRDGSLVLSCGKGMEHDLVFASGAMTGDPALIEQREILEGIAACVNKDTTERK